LSYLLFDRKYCRELLALGYPTQWLAATKSSVSQWRHRGLSSFFRRSCFADFGRPLFAIRRVECFVSPAVADSRALAPFARERDWLAARSASLFIRRVEMFCVAGSR
jgi:hypothetical protein